MIGPAEIEDMRLDLLAIQEQAALNDVAMAPLRRHWASRGAPSLGCVERICELAYERAADRPSADWRSVADEAAAGAGYAIVWNGDEVACLHRDPASLS